MNRTNEEKARELVSREVFHSVNQTIALLLASENHEEFDDAMNLAFGVIDWEDAATAEGWEQADEDGGFLNTRTGEFSIDNPETDERDLVVVEPFEFFNTETGYTSPADDWEDLCAEQGIDGDDYRREPLEFWAVSGWLADHLERCGQPVAELLDFHVWGRCTSGQAIYADSVIGEVLRQAERDYQTVVDENAQNAS